jgi:hypothetical protein
MWKTLKNISSAVKDVVVIASKEAAFQAAKVNEKSGSATDKLAKKAHELREHYEVELASRKEGIDGILVIRKHDGA